MTGAAPTLLEYASPAAAREPWGPLVFRPSRRSLILLLLSAVAVTWLALRHHPWRLVASVPSDYHLAPLFTLDNQILAFDTRSGINLYDPATGRLIRNVLPSLDTGTNRYYVVASGRQILALPWTDRTALLYDVQTGRVIDRFPNPGGGTQIVTFASDPLRVVCYTPGVPEVFGITPPPTTTTQLRMWELSRLPAATQPIYLPSHGIGATFSDDGQRIFQGLSDSGFLLLDATAHLVGWQDYPPRPVTPARLPARPFSFRFSGPNYFWVARNNASIGADVIEIRSASTGELLNTVSLPARTIDRASWVLSDDAALLALFDPTTTGVAGTIKLDFHDTAQHRVIASGWCQAAWPAVFFPRSHHLLAPDADASLLAVIDPAHTQPLALLPNSSTSSSTTAPEIAPDSQTLVISTGAHETMLNIYRRAGLDCPESPLGAIAFPQTWLTAAGFIALSLSLLHDARRARRASSRPPSRLITTLLIAITLPLTLHAILTACLGRPTLTPAPLLLAAVIGLATNSRFWRFTTLLTLTATLPLCLYLARHIQQLGLKSATRYPIFDRFHDIPNLLPLAALAAASLLIIIALPLLARPRAAVPG